MTWTLDPAHSAVTFSAKHMMLTTVRGSMAIREMELAFDLERPDSASVRVTLDAASIDTGQGMRDQHLRSADFLETEAHPTIGFVSTAVEPRGAGRYALHGNLTIRGVTRPVVLDAEMGGVVPDWQGGGRRAAFRARTTIDREAFGLTWNVALEQGGWLVSRDVAIDIELAVTGPAATVRSAGIDAREPEAVTA